MLGAGHQVIASLRNVVKRMLPGFIVLRFAGGGMSSAAMRGSVGALAIKCVSLLLSFLSTVMLSRALGVQGFGAYSLAIGWMLLIAVPVQSGLVGVVVREIARYKATQAWPLAKGLLIFSNSVSVSLALLSALTLGIYWSLGGASEQGLNVEAAMWALLLLPIYCLSAVRSGTLRGLGKVLAGLAPDEMIRPLIQVVVLAIIVLAMGRAISPANAMQIQVASAAIAFAIGATLLLRSIPKEVGAAEAEFVPRTWLVPALSFALVSGFGTILQSSVVVALGMASGAQDAGLFKAAQQLAALSGIVVVAVNSASAPYIASLYRVGDRHELSKLLRNTALVMLAGTAPLSITMIVFGEQIISLVFSSAFVDAYRPLFLLAMGQLGISSLGLVGLLLNMSGHERDTLVCCAVALVITIGASNLLIGPYGATGAAGAVVMGQFALNFLLLWRVRVRVGLSTSIFSRIQPPV